MRTSQKRRREIDCLCCREVKAMLVASTKFHLVMQILWVTVTRVCFIYLGGEFFFLVLRQLNEMNTLGESKVLSVSFWFLSGGMRKGDESKISYCYSRGLRASPQNYRKRGGVTSSVQCLQMIQLMVVGFCSIGG